MAFNLAIIIVEGFIQANKKTPITRCLVRVDIAQSRQCISTCNCIITIFHSIVNKKLDPQLDIAMDWNFNIIINEYMTCLCLCHLTKFKTNISKKSKHPPNSTNGIEPLLKQPCVLAYNKHKEDVGSCLSRSVPRTHRYHPYGK